MASLAAAADPNAGMDKRAVTTTSPAATSEGRDVPLSDWAAPQYFDLARGVTSNLAGFITPTGFAKSSLTLSTFIPITPCRLVDTRGAFSPAIPSPGPFAANEVRTYRIPGNCGVPSGTDRVKAVSLAITTPPTAASGDIEVVPDGATLGSTVVMVIQAGQWNSATTVSGTDAEGDIKTQLRGTAGHVVIDINGYYASTNSNTTQSDYFTISGAYDSTGGLLYVTNASSVGSAINASSYGAQVYLAGNGNAVDIKSGAIRVTGAGIGTDTVAFVHKVDSAAGGNVCAANSAYTTIDNFYTNGNPNAILIITPVEYYAGGDTGFLGTSVPAVTAYYSINACGVGRWTIRRGDNTPHVNGSGFNVLVLRP